MENSTIIDTVRSKKKLAYIDDEIIQEKIDEYLNSHPKLKIDELNFRSSNFKKIVKYARQKIHPIYTVFQTSSTAKRHRYLKDLKKAIKNLKRDKIIEVRKKILSSHISTKERLGNFELIYKKIFSFTGIPKKIVDLGSGLNAFSIGMMGLQDLEYVAVEISQTDCDFINEYFKILEGKGSRIKGDAIKIDLEKVDEKTLKGLNCDICFAFKLFDIIDNKQVEKIINTLPAKKFAISFSKVTVGNKKMKQIRRSGFQKMLRRLEIDYETFEIGNELFYVFSR